MLSVIIPIYNTRRYLDKCLASVSGQSYKNLEIILVNDCSTDSNTIEIIRKWVRQDSRIRLIDKQHNGGVDQARMDGISSSHGDYLAFVDSDDWLPSDAFESMMQKIVEIGADMVKGNFANMWLGGMVKKIPTVNPSLPEREILHNELMEKYYISYFGVNIIPVVLWGTVYKRSLFVEANIQSTGLRFGEDLVMNMKIFPFVRKFYQMDRVVYYYRQGMPTMSDKYLNNWLSNFNRLYKIKIQQIETTGYTQAIFFQKVELVNYLKSFVEGCILWRKDRINESILELQQELKDPIYQDIQSFMKSEKMKTLAAFIEQGAAFQLWSYVSEQHARNLTFKQRIKEGLISILSKVKF